MQRFYEKYGYDDKQPTMYRMACWIVKESARLGIENMTIEEYIEWATFFFKKQDRHKLLINVF